LKIKHKVASGPLGGDQEIGSLVTKDEVAAAFFFIDPLSAHPHDADIKALVRIMDVHNIACATNPITGSALIAAFQSNIGNFRNCLYVDHSRDESEVVLTYKMHQQTVIKDTKE
jgi:methylglyoxal synthase